MIDHFKWCCSVDENVFEFHRSPVNSTHKGQWRGALMFCLICTCRVNNRDAGDLGRHLAHYDVTVMKETCGACAHPDGLAPLGNETSAYRHCDGEVSTLLHGSLIMAWIKWPSFCRRFFQVHFFSIKISELWLKFHRNLFNWPIVQLTISQNTGSGNGLVTVTLKPGHSVRFGNIQAMLCYVDHIYHKQAMIWLTVFLSP